jgi:hypothetical protein
MKRLAMMLGALGATAVSLTARAEGLRDPTRPPIPPSHTIAAREPAPVLSAVLSFNGTRSAIFNGHLVHSGSVVGAYTIDAVLEDGVSYRHAGQSHELHLAHTDTIKKPAAEAQRAPSGVSR